MQGRALLESTSYREACDKLRRARSWIPPWAPCSAWAECYEQQARVASAWFTFREAVALAVRRGDARQLLAQHRADVLEPRLARMAIHVDPREAGLSVRVDGQAIAREALGTPLPVDPGMHHLEARDDLRWARDVEVPDNGSSVEVDVPSLLAPVQVAVAGPPAWRRPLSIALIDVGMVATGVGLVFGMQAVVKGRDVNGECPPPASTCGSASAVQENGTAQTYADVATVLVPVGLAVAALGGVLLATTGASIDASASPHDARASFRWRW